MWELFSLLAAGGPSSAIGERRQLYAFLIGDGEVHSIWYPAEGEVRQAQGIWRSAWILGGLGVREGLALDGSSLQRWTFSEITDSGFRWRAESSRDGGETWHLDQEMRGRESAPDPDLDRSTSPVIVNP
jgi:hypothetical protein